MKAIILFFFFVINISNAIATEPYSNATIVVITDPKSIFKEISKNRSSFYEKLQADFKGSHHNILLTSGANGVNLLEMKSLNDYKMFFNKAVIELNRASRITNSLVTAADFYKVIDQFSRTSNLKVIIYGNKEKFLNIINKGKSFNTTGKTKYTYKAIRNIDRNYRTTWNTLLFPILLIISILIIVLIIINNYKKKQKEKEVENKNKLKKEKEILESKKNKFESSSAVSANIFTINVLLFFIILNSILYASSNGLNNPQTKYHFQGIKVFDISKSALKIKQYKYQLKKKIIEAEISKNIVITYGNNVKVYDFNKVKSFLRPDSLITYDNNTEIVEAIYKTKSIADSLRSTGKKVLVEFWGDFDFDRDEINQSLLLLKNKMGETKITINNSLFKTNGIAYDFISLFPIRFRDKIFFLFALISITFFFLMIILFIKNNKRKRILSRYPKILNFVNNETNTITKINLIKPQTNKFKIGYNFDSDLRINLDNLISINLDIGKEINCNFIKKITGVKNEK